MSLEENILDLTIAVQQLTAALGRTQAPGPDSFRHELKYAPVTGLLPANEDEAKAQRDAERKVPNALSSTATTSGEQSQPTGESSSPVTYDPDMLEDLASQSAPLDYVKDVKPITIRLSKEKGREITIGVLSRFGVKSAQDLEPVQWEEYIAHCEKVLAGGEV